MKTTIAAQIAADIRAECLPHRLPQHMETRLEAIIDANLAGERAKVSELILASEMVLKMTIDGDLTTVEIDELRAALFNLQA